MSARFGIKGSDAAALLQHLGLRIPTQSNRVTHWPAEAPLGSGRCLRLGHSEFLIELDSGLPPLLPGGEAFPNAWTLIRCDHSMVLSGATLTRELSQLCSFDFSRLQDEPDLVVMTLLAGIGVIVIREPIATSAPTDTTLRLWCDASFSAYLQQCLHSLRGPR